MTVKTLKLTDAQDAKLILTAASRGLDTSDIIMTAVDVLLSVAADADYRLRMMFDRIDASER